MGKGLKQTFLQMKSCSASLPVKDTQIKTTMWYHFTSIRSLAKSLQSCPTLCDPIDGSLPGSAVPGILQARTLEWVAISFSNAWKWKVKGKSLSRVRLFMTPWTAAYQAPPSMGFSRQEYWSGVPSPSPSIRTAVIKTTSFTKGKKRNEKKKRTLTRVGKNMQNMESIVHGQRECNVAATEKNSLVILQKDEHRANT